MTGIPILVSSLWKVNGAADPATQAGPTAKA